MSEDIKDAPKDKPKFTKDYIDSQIAQTTKDLNYFMDQVQRMTGLLNYLRTVKADFDLPEAEKKPTLEVK